MNTGTLESSSFSNIIALLIIRNELRYPGQQFIILENELLSGVPEFIPDY
jgi:hypothetical protein